MLVDIFAASLEVGVLAKAAITWTPVTFYVVATVIHTLMILLLFKVLHVDPEHNSFIGALIAALIGNAAVFFLRDFGLFGNLGAAAIYFATLAAVSSGEVLKSLVVFTGALAVYAGLALFLVPRTPLTAETINGLPKIMITGGFTAEPISEEQADELAKPVEK